MQNYQEKLGKRRKTKQKRKNQPKEERMSRNRQQSVRIFHCPPDRAGYATAADEHPNQIK